MGSPNLYQSVLPSFHTENGAKYTHFPVSYEVYGKPLGSSAPLILVVHALTGNSTLIGENGWCDALIGEGKLMDTSRFSILSFNIPGNGYDVPLESVIKDYRHFTARDIAQIFLSVCEQISITHISFAIGSSLGGAIVWEMSLLAPPLIQTLIPVAVNWQLSDWTRAYCLTQQRILENSSNPLYDARLAAMPYYRTPDSIDKRFSNSWNEEKKMFNIESWLHHHGEKIVERYTLASYRMMNHLLQSADVLRNRGTAEQVASQVQSRVVMLGINTDLLFPPRPIKQTVKLLKQANKETFYEELVSPFGHDAFLIDFDQTTHLLKPYFEKKYNETTDYC